MQFSQFTSKQLTNKLPKSEIYFLQNKFNTFNALATHSLKEPQSTELWHGVRLIKKEKLPVFTAPFEIDIHDVELKTKKISCVLNSRNIVVSTEELPAQLTGTVLRLAAKERLQANGIWMPNQEMEMQLHPLKESGQNRLYNITLVPSQDIQAIMELHSLKGISLEGIMTLVHCVSGLVSTLFSEPAMVLYCEQNYLQLMAVGNKMVYFLQILPYEMEDTLPMFMLNQAMEIAKINVKRLYGLDIPRVLALGPKYHLCPSAINEIELLQPDWQSILTVPSNEHVTRFPGLYGAYFADSSLNFIPKTWQYAITLQKLGKIATVLAGILTFGIGGYGAYLYQINQHKKMEYENLFHSISTRQAAIAAHLPPDTTKAELETWLTLQKAANERPRLDDMLARIAKALEPEVTVVTLNISTMPQVQSTVTSAANKPSVPADQQTKTAQNMPIGPFQISLQMESKGSFEETRLRINSTLSKLCSNFQLSEPNLQYDETQKICTVTCNMTPKPLPTITEVQS